MKHKDLVVNILIIVFVAACMAAAAFFVAGDAVRNAGTSHTRQAGRWHNTTKRSASPVADTTYARLIGLGYLQGYTTPSAAKGVTVYEKGTAYEGVNLSVSGHAPAAFLLDMKGSTLHAWQYKPAWDIWHDVRSENVSASFWRRVHLYGNGDMLAIYEGIGLIKIDKDSNLLWAYHERPFPHHDLDVVDNGTIYVLTRRKRELSHISTADVYDEYITLLSPEGRVLAHHSITDLIESSPYARLLDDEFVRTGGYYGHILHVNTVEVFRGDQHRIFPHYKKGNILLSILIINTICIVDLEKGAVVWALGPGMWKHQHQPTVLQGGAMLVFDNKETETDSQVMEFDPATQKVLWQYVGDENSPFFSQTCGSNQRLPNGNTLITETDSGRAFEVTPSGEIVWEYINPFRAGDDDELIASLFEMIRIDAADYPFIGEVDRGR